MLAIFLCPQVSSEKSPNCTHSGFVFFIPHGNLESDISVKLKNICLLMNKLISDHSMEKSDLSINASTAKATSENASDLEMDNKVCSKCSFLANKMVIMVIEIDRKERGGKMEIIRDLILDEKLPNCVYVSVIVCHSDSCLNKVGSLTASVLRNQDLGLNQQVLYVG